MQGLLAGEWNSKVKGSVALKDLEILNVGPGDWLRGINTHQFSVSEEDSISR